ncbi:ABC transporter permease [Salinicoccus roseus]|uniref:ABC transporter permease n=1 Tax=Salinicoccus roseus TaxID=45670 RepID=UPI001584F136|nr:ABC transporter permease [Salinicoccus roseus]
MTKIFDLVRNELTKIYVLKSTWAMYLFLVALVIFSLIMNTVTDSVDSETTYSDDWKTELQEENQTLMEEIETEGEEDPFIESTNMSLIEQNTYHLENDIRPYGYHAGNFVLFNLFTTSLVSLVVIIIAGGIVANEFRWGTIKQLLIRPISRSGILLSKYITVLLFTLFTLLFLVATSIIVGLIAYGLPAINPEIIVTRPDGMSSNGMLSEIVMQYGFKVLNIIILATFGFMISSIFRSSSLAIALSMFLMFAGTTAAQALAQYTWSKYILFANTDLSVYFTPYGPIREEMTVGFSVGVIAVYMVIFIIAAWAVFTKRDVA